MSDQQPYSNSALIHYPDSDGEPIAENTLQFEWIVTLKGNLDALFRKDLRVFVAGDLLWYPVEGDNETRAAPDTMVIFGRPKGYRGSYRQWEEEGIAPQVVFEVLSPGNRPGAMENKFHFYEDHGVDEYYVIDPNLHRVRGWLRRAGRLEPIADMKGWVSPRLGIRFEMGPATLRVLHPDGRPFSTFMELEVQIEREKSKRLREVKKRIDAEQSAEAIMKDLEQSQMKAEQARRDKEELYFQIEEERKQRETALVQAEEAFKQREATLLRAERLADKLKELGLDPDQVT